MAVAVRADIDHGYLWLEIVEITGACTIPAAMMVYVEHINTFGAQKGASGRIRALCITPRPFAHALHISCGEIVKVPICDQQSDALIIFLRGGKSLPIDKSPIRDNA